MPTLDRLTRREDAQTAGKAPYRLLEHDGDAEPSTLENLSHELVRTGKNDA